MDATTPLPTGTVTFLFTDIEGSTRLLQHLGERYAAVLADHHRLLREALQAWGGNELGTEGDAFCVVFPQASDALAAALAAQRALATHPWPEGALLRVRMGLHTGAPTVTPEGYVGLDLHRAARLRDAAHGNQILLSERTRSLVAADLPAGVSLRDLGAHRLKDLQQPEHLFQLLAPDLPADFPQLRSLEAFRHNLPVQLTSFIGREQAMAEVTRLLAATRLLTLIGSGGCGKTRLALQVAAALLDGQRDGVWLVELAPLSDPALVPQIVASVLGVREEPGRALTPTLVEHLKPKKLLLVLDNCEHLLAACAQLADLLLRSCPDLRVLATSREGLGIAGETTYRVPSLSLPELKSLPTAEGLAAFEAPRLFLERAMAAVPSFAVHAENASAVATVCQRLDGIPLAIELAAARVKALPVVQIAARLDDRFRLLTGGSRTALPRQQTLRALIDWSYELLAEQERVLLRRLSVFAGGWTLEAAEAVCAGEGLDSWEVLDLLTQLVEKSLVVYEERQGEARYRLLETVRQYGRERLAEAGEVEAVQRHHRDFFLGLAERARTELRGPEHGAWLERLETEHDNLRAALAWSLTEAGGAEAGLRLAGALWVFWEMRRHCREGAEWLAAVLNRPEAAARSAVRAEALWAAAWLAQDWANYQTQRALYEESLAISRELENPQGIAAALRGLGSLETDTERRRALHEESLAIERELGNRPGIAYALVSLGEVVLDQEDYGGVRTFLEESLAIFRELRDWRGMAISLNILGQAALQQGDYETARTLYEESLAIGQELGATWFVTYALDQLGLIAQEQGEYESARSLYDECLAIRRELGEQLDIAWTLVHMGLLARRQEDYEAARTVLEESLALRRELGNKADMASSLFNLGLLATAQKQFASARARHEESLAIGRELGNRGTISDALQGFADLAVAQGQATRAARLFGAVEAHRETAGVRWEGHQSDYRRGVAAARTQLGEAAFTAAWAEGRALTVEQAIALALDETPEVCSSPRPTPRRCPCPR